MSEGEAVIRRYFDAWNAKDESVLDEVIAPDHVHHAPANADVVTGPAGMKQLMRKYMGAFPDTRFTIEAVVDQGAVMAVRWTAVGIHQGALDGIAPTGNVVTVLGLTIMRVAGGKIAESWVNWDFFGLRNTLLAGG